MAVNTDLVGTVYPPLRYEVSREKIREFAEAVGDANPAYVDPGAARGLGHPDVIAPPTFAVVATRDSQLAVINDPQLGLDFSRVVHGDQRFAMTRPITAGDVLIVTATLDTIRTLAGNDIVTIRNDLVTTAGEPVVSVWATLVSRAPEGEES